MFTTDLKTSDVMNNDYSISEVNIWFQLIAVNKDTGIN